MRKWWGLVLAGMALIGSAQAMPQRKPVTLRAPSIWLLHKPIEFIRVIDPVPRPAQRVLIGLDRKGFVADLGRAEVPIRQQIACLALAMYHEARGQTEVERIAVAQVIFNRMLATGNSVCATIWARNGSEFPWVKRLDVMPQESVVWQNMQILAIGLIHHRPADLTHGATFFFNPRLCTPPWGQTGKITLRLQNVFVRAD